MRKHRPLALRGGLDRKKRPSASYNDSAPITYPWTRYMCPTGTPQGPLLATVNSGARTRAALKTLIESEVRYAGTTQVYPGEVMLSRYRHKATNRLGLGNGCFPVVVTLVVQRARKFESPIFGPRSHSSVGSDFRVLSRATPSATRAGAPVDCAGNSQEAGAEAERYESLGVPICARAFCASAAATSRDPLGAHLACASTLL